MPLDPQNLKSPPACAVLEEAGNLLRAGQLVAFPTETVYGLGANALDEAACAKIFAAKGRPADNPLIVHIADIAMLANLAEVTPLALRLAEAFWSGPLTIVLPKRPGIPDLVSAGLPTVGIRWPANPIAQALIQAAGCPLAAPSANVSGRPSPTLARHVLEDLDGKIPLIIDGGAVDIGLESTVVDASGEQPLILRPGQLSAADLAKVLGCEVAYASAKNVERPSAPGMKYKHYAPKGELRLAATRAEVLSLRQELAAKYGAEPLCIVTEDAAKPWPADAEVFLIAAKGDLASYAHNMFAALRYADANEYAAVVMETVPAEGLGVAIMNRLRKAANLDADAEV